MKRNFYCIPTLISLFIFTNISQTKGDIYDITTGYSFGYPVCPGVQYAYASREIPGNCTVIWTVQNGKFSDYTTTAVRYGQSPIEVTWDDVLAEGKLSFSIIDNEYDFIKDNTTQKILSIKNITIPSVSVDNFIITNNTITIPRGKKGTFKITVPEMWYKKEWKDFSECKISTFEWRIPKTLGGNGNPIKSGAVYTITYDESNGDGEKIQVRPASDCNNNSYGKTFTITIKRTGSAFNGNIRDIDIKDTKSYEYANLYLQNVNILSGANVNLNGYNSVRIVPGFHAETGSDVHIFNAPPKTKSTKAITQETAIKNIEAEIDTEAVLFQNKPNPVVGETIIPCIIPETAQNAYLQITNSFGKVIRKMPITEKGQVSVALNREELTAGIYMYSLIINNKIIDTKRMIITMY